MSENLLTVKRAAARLNLAESTVRGYCAAGRLGEKIGGRWIIQRAELDAFAKRPRPVGRPPKEEEGGE